MRSYPIEKYELEELDELNAQDWMIELLKANPDYCCWGNNEDYMWNDKEGWSSRQSFGTWGAFQENFGGLDDLNECVNFYFQVTRDSKLCELCAGDGYHPDARWVSDSFYRHSSPFKSQNAMERSGRAFMESFGASFLPHPGESFPTEETLAKYGPEFRAFCEDMRTRHHWDRAITQDEADALRDSHRGPKEGATAEQWNSGSDSFLGDFGHDAINRGVLIHTRLERMGIPSSCPDCEGNGHIYTATEAKVQLQLWILHPRKGCSRGVLVEEIKREELPEAAEYLATAAARNAQRFSRVGERVKALTETESA